MDITSLLLGVGLGFVAAVGVFAAVQLWRGHARWK